MQPEIIFHRKYKMKDWAERDNRSAHAMLYSYDDGRSKFCEKYFLKHQHQNKDIMELMDDLHRYSQSRERRIYTIIQLTRKSLLVVTGVMFSIFFINLPFVQKLCE